MLTAQLALTCSKSTIETQEQCGKSVQVNNKDTRTTSITPFWCLIVNFEEISLIVLVFLLLTLNK